MSWSTPTLKDVRKLVRDSVAAALGAAATVPNSVLRIMSDTKAGLAHLVLLYIDWLSKQMLPDTAETEWLDRHGNIWLKNSDGSVGRKAASFAQGTIFTTGTALTEIPSGTILSNGEVRYQTTADVTQGELPTPVNVVALTPGAIGNIEAGEFLSFEEPIFGIESNAEVNDIDGGADEENDDDLRARTLLRIQNPPMGGAENDYVKWAISVPGVTRAWAYPLEMGIGTVTVRFMMDDLRSAQNGIPTEDDADDVAEYLDTVRPVAVKDFFVEPPIPYPYDLTINELTVDNASVRARIEIAIKTMEAVRAKPGGKFHRSWVDEAISSAVGEDSHELIFDTLTMPSAGHIPVLGTIYYGT